MHNLVLELTRLSIEVKNLKMRVESVSGRLDFSDRRARALESVVQYRPGTGPAAEPAATAVSTPAPSTAQTARRDVEAAGVAAPVKGEAQRARRRRRRRGRSAGAGQPVAGGAAAEEPGEAGDGADTPDAGGRDGGNGLPFDGREPGPAEAPSRVTGEPTDQ
jgi:hypothetical protein